MQNELVIDKIKSEKKSDKIDLSKVLKTIANDSLFYFAVFFTILVILQLLPFWGGMFEYFSFGINEVAVSFIGFLNVFFFQFYTKILSKFNC